MDDSVRLVTQLEILCEALQPNLIMLIMDIQSCHPKVGLTPQELRRWWALKNAPYPANATVLTAYFGVASIEELGLGVTRRAARYRAHLNPEELRKEVFDRRRILKTMAAAGGVAAAAGLRVPVSDLIATGQLLDGYRKIGDVEVEHARGAATDLAVAYAAAPNADARRAAEAYAYSLLDLLRPGRVEMSGETRRSLLSVASDAAALAGTGQLGAGRFDRAKRWFDKALELAEEAGDPRLQALTHAAFADIPMGMPEPDHAASVAALQSAAALQRCLPPVARAGVFGSLGCEIAATGDDLVSGRFLDEALRAAALIPYDEPGWGWWSIHGRFNGWDGPHRPEVYTAGRAM